MKKIILTSIIALLLSGCALGRRSDAQNDCSQFLPQIAGNPAVRAKEEMSHGDYRFLAVTGAGIELPGLEDISPERETELLKKYGSKAIQGTTDAALSESCDVFNLAARSFATTFNRTKLQKLR